MKWFIFEFLMLVSFISLAQSFEGTLVYVTDLDDRLFKVPVLVPDKNRDAAKTANNVQLMRISK